MKTILLALSILCLMTLGCAHHRDVRPGPEGLNRVVVKSEDRDGKGQRNALSQAEHYCKQFNKSPVIMEEKDAYTGSVDEESYKTGKTVSKVLTTVGGATSVFGGRNERNLGRVGLLGGVATDAALGEGYTIEMKFKCQ